jgi:O-antigen/teichoic acid export membrane protein
MLGLFAKGQSLVLVTTVDSGTPFLRMLLLSHGLSLRELGFASALTATYSAFEVMTDFAIYRFVFSQPREHYQEALASAHALSILRGGVVGVIAAAVSPLIAKGLSLPADWPSFALLGPIILIRSMENLAPRVAERDYRYGVQLRVSLIANTLGLVTLATALHFVRDHRVLLASLFAQTVGLVVASHALADTPYRLRLRSRFFGRAFRFGYPLMVNGLGLAVSSQGDRFIVGSMLGLPALGVYSVAILVTTVPVGMVARIGHTVLLAAFYNSERVSSSLYWARVRLAARITPLFYGVVGLGVLTLMNIIVPLVFGRNFVLSRDAIALLALGTFFRFARGEPVTAMLMNQGRTRRLAVANLSSVISLFFEGAAILVRSRLEAVFVGRLLGELFAAAITLAVARRQFRAALHDYATGIGAALVVLGGATMLTFTTPVGEEPLVSLAALLACVALYVGWAFRPTIRLFQAGFPGQKNAADDNRGTHP